VIVFEVTQTDSMFGDIIDFFTKNYT